MALDISFPRTGGGFATPLPCCGAAWRKGKHLQSDPGRNYISYCSSCITNSLPQVGTYNRVYSITLYLQRNVPAKMVESIVSLVVEGSICCVVYFIVSWWTVLFVS